MGRTSKFSFPIPGRKHSANKEAAAKPTRPSTANQSKAQRILGTENPLYIDSPIQDEYTYGFPSPKPSRMSVAISESTSESESLYNSQSEQWDKESGVFPRIQPRLDGKASSTLLGKGYGDEGYRDDGTMSISSGRLRHGDSSSTLRSHYDRQKSPLSISQQTSDSSARDLALRKGFPPVVQRIPKLQVDSSDKQFSRGNRPAQESGNQGDFSRDRASRKKPAKLDLSMLFAGTRKREPASLATKPYPSRTPRVSGEPGNRKITKVPSKDSLRSKQGARSNQSYDQRKRNSLLTSGTLHQLYDNYEQMPVNSPRMDRIPETKVPERTLSRNHEISQLPKPEPFPLRSRDDGKYFRPESSGRGSKGRDPVRSPEEREGFSWKNVRSSMTSPGYGASSAASISSRNTKTSRHTAGSSISNSNLKMNSVLSLSSDSEGESGFDQEAYKSAPSKGKTSRAPPHKSSDYQRHERENSGGLTPRSHGSKNSSRRGSGQDKFRTIPEALSTDTQYARETVREQPSRISNQREDPSRLSNRRKEPQFPAPKERRSSRKPSIASATALQPTPPLSPTSIEREGSEGSKRTSQSSSRMMAVTKQEEALLEALRQKRARMREEIIEEHEKSPPRIPAKHRSRPSASSMNTVRGNEQHEILLYLDAPISDTHHIDLAEPSPDLSDFLSFGSDEDSTPRTSWAPPPRSQARPDSAVRSRHSKVSPITPPSAARLSAVGAPEFLRHTSTETVKKRNTGVRFIEDPKLANGQDFLLEDSEIWGM